MHFGLLFSPKHASALYYGARFPIQLTKRKEKAQFPRLSLYNSPFELLYSITKHQNTEIQLSYTEAKQCNNNCSYLHFTKDCVVSMVMHNHSFFTSVRMSYVDIELNFQIPLTE